MKVLSFLALCGVIAISAPIADAASGKNKPGYCNNDEDCTKKAAGYSCVSVQTTRANVDSVKQCLPNNANNPTCAGVQPGLCPSFSTTWGTEFRQISSVCAYILPEGTTKCITETSNSTKGLVECMNIKDPDSDKALGVIYGCVDFDGTRLLFEKNSKSDKLSAQFEYPSIIADNCVNPKNPSGATFVCSSQGTCAPQSKGQLDYSCKCNVGFSGKYCEKIDDNKCYNDGVCGGGSCDLVKQECQACPAGTKGNKCAECDPTYAEACGGHGKCVATSGTSTIGADTSDDGSSSGTSTKKTTAPSPSPSKSNSTSSSSSSKADDSKGTVAPPGGSGSKGGEATGSTSGAPSITRFLATGAYQCKCDEGYSDVHCGVKLKSNGTKNGTTTPTPSSTSMLSMSIAGVAVAIAAVVGSI